MQKQFRGRDDPAGGRGQQKGERGGCEREGTRATIGVARARGEREQIFGEELLSEAEIPMVARMARTESGSHVPVP